MSKTNKIDHVKARWADIMSCISCGDCGYAVRPAIGRYLVCPVKEAKGPGGFEPTFSRGRMNILKSLLEGRIELGAELVDSVYECTECGSCNEVCHKTHNPGIVLNTSKWIDHIEVWHALRQDLVASGLAPLDKHAKLLSCMSDPAMRNPYGEPKASMTAWAAGVHGIAKGSDIALFAGCTYPLRLPGTMKNLARVFSAAGLTFSLLDDEWCCGSVALRVGDVGAAKETILHDIEQVKASGARAVFALCAGCYRTMSKDWPIIAGGALPFEVLHVTQVLADLMGKKRIRLAPRADQKHVAFHDPCHLGRHMGVYEPPRDVIRALPGTTLAELPRNRGNAWCCGAGGGVKSQYPDLARDIARNRIEEATREKIDVLLSSCPFCVSNLQDATHPGSVTLQVIDIIDYVASFL